MRSGKTKFAQKRTLLGVISIAVLLLLGGCKSTNYKTSIGPTGVGPGSVAKVKAGKRVFNYNSKIFMDVAVPVFNPGFPLMDDGSIDYDMMGELDIVPSLRRTEATRFAVSTRKALADTKAFGQVFNTPESNTTADIFVLGTIMESDSQMVTINVDVLNSAGDVLGQKAFEWEVSKHFYVDPINKNKDSYQPVFNAVAGYVFDVVNRLPDSEKARIKDTARVRYAQHYSPEAFGDYVQQETKRKGKSQYVTYNLVGMPAEGDKMLKRTEVLRGQEMMFISRMQDQFDTFDAQTEEAYRKWQFEMLPEVAKARELESERNTKAVIGTLLAATAILLDKNSNSGAGQVGKVAGAVGGAWLLKDAYEANSDLEQSRTILEEYGAGMNRELAPTVMDFKGKTVELSGTAAEQYEQWKAHLKTIYELESTPQQVL